MSESTKIEFSPYQWQCLNNTDFFIAKAENTVKVKAFLGHLSEVYQSILKPAHTSPYLNNSASPKISTGENYEGLPYITLDYPRVLMDENNFLIVRTFFWWGKGVSLQLIVSGLYTQILMNLYGVQDAWISTTADELWNNHIAEPAFKRLNAGSLPPTADTKVKIAYVWPLEKMLTIAFEQEVIDKFKTLINLN